MKALLAVVALLVCLISAPSAQDKSQPGSQLSGNAGEFSDRISCTPDVPSKICQAATSTFSNMRLSSRGAQVELLIAGPQGFAKEYKRISTQFEDKIHKLAADTVTEEFVRAFNRAPIVRPVHDSDDVMFVLSDEGPRFIRTVVVSTDSFRGFDVRSTLNERNENIARITRTDFDPSQLNNTAWRIEGYVDGWNWSRFRQMAEQ